MSEEIYQCGLYTHPPKKCRIPSCPFCKGERPVMSIDWTKPVETFEGQLVQILSLSRAGNIGTRGDKNVIFQMIEPSVRQSEVINEGHIGVANSETGEGYVFNIKQVFLRNRKTKKEGWINLYDTRSGGRMPSAFVHQTVHQTKEELEKQGGWANGCVATIKIEWEE